MLYQTKYIFPIYFQSESLAACLGLPAVLWFLFYQRWREALLQLKSVLLRHWILSCSSGEQQILGTNLVTYPVQKHKTQSSSRVSILFSTFSGKIIWFFSRNWLHKVLCLAPWWVMGPWWKNHNPLSFLQLELKSEQSSVQEQREIANLSPSAEHQSSLPDCSGKGLKWHKMSKLNHFCVSVRSQQWHQPGMDRRLAWCKDLTLPLYPAFLFVRWIKAESNLNHGEQELR